MFENLLNKLKKHISGDGQDTLEGQNLLLNVEDEQPASLNLYKQELSQIMDESAAKTHILKQELERQQSLLAVSYGMEKNAKERMNAEQQELNRMEADSRAALMELSFAKQKSDRLMQVYNDKLEKVKALHNHLDHYTADLAEQQAHIKKLLEELQQHDYFFNRQQQVLNALQAGDTSNLPPLNELVAPDIEPPADKAEKTAKSEKDHANANFWDKKKHTALNFQQPEDAEGGENDADLPNRTELTPARSVLRTVLSYTVCVVLAVLFALVIRSWVLMPTEVSGTSMSPTLESQDKLLTSPLPYIWGKPHRGDIVVFQAPNSSDGVLYVKRVIGLSGDHILIEDGDVFVNSTKLNEPYLDNIRTEGYVNTIVPQGQIFVLGDNRTVSHDSRDSDIACIDLEKICGKAVWRIYPFGSFGSIY